MSEQVMNHISVRPSTPGGLRGDLRISGYGSEYGLSDVHGAYTHGAGTALFPAVLPESKMTRADARNVIESLRREAADAPEFSLDEINAEIKAAREERKARG